MSEEEKLQQIIKNTVDAMSHLINTVTFAWCADKGNESTDHITLLRSIIVNLVCNQIVELSNPAVEGSIDKNLEVTINDMRKWADIMRANTQTKVQTND